MKTLLAFLAVIMFGFKAGNLSDKLSKENEEIIFSFKLEKNQKIVSVCKDKNNNYLIYRFGNKEKLEFSFPLSVNKNSWKNFTYYSIHRGGGKKNAAFGNISLSFSNKGVQYKIFHYWRDGQESNQIGIEINTNGQIITLKGDLKTQTGALQELDHLPDLIVNTAED